MYIFVLLCGGKKKPSYNNHKLLRWLVWHLKLRVRRRGYNTLFINKQPRQIFNYKKMAEMSNTLTANYRVLVLMGNTNISAKDISAALQQSFCAIGGGSNLVCDAALDGFEGLQLFERNEYNFLVLPQKIGMYCAEMDGIEFLKIAQLMRENEENICTTVMILDRGVCIDDGSESSWLNEVGVGKRKLVTKAIFNDPTQGSVTFSDISIALRDLIATSSSLATMSSSMQSDTMNANKSLPPLPSLLPDIVLSLDEEEAPATVFKA
jgi:hypothetical protein